MRTGSSRRSLGASALALLLACAPAFADDSAALLGQWSANVEEPEGDTYAFLADGRYHYTLDIAGNKLTETGTYTFDGEELTFTARAGGSKAFRASVDGDELTLSADDVAERTYTRTAGTAEVEAEAKKVDARKAAEDAKWAKKISLGEVEPGGQSGGTAGVPEDPNPDRHYKGATVFNPTGGYLRVFSPNERAAEVEGDDPGNGQNETRWFFFPNGRFFHKGIVYRPAGRGRARAQVSDTWGRYRITDGEERGTQTVEMEFEGGEKATAVLSDGRRVLDLGGVLYEDPDWGLEKLRRSTDRDDDSGQGGGEAGGGEAGGGEDDTRPGKNPFDVTSPESAPEEQENPFDVTSPEETAPEEPAEEPGDDAADDASVPEE